MSTGDDVIGINHLWNFCRQCGGYYTSKSNKSNHEKTKKHIESKYSENYYVDLDAELDKITLKKMKQRIKKIQKLYSDNL